MSILIVRNERIIERGFRIVLFNQLFVEDKSSPSLGEDEEASLS
jgi:hypothetical protein